MRVVASLRSVVSALFHRSRIDKEMEEELRAHIQDRANDLERSGVPRAEAGRRARLEFGGCQKFKGECREAQGPHFLETLIQDLRFGLRMLRKSPGFTAVAILTLALGIGANTAIFTMTNGLMLHTLPVRDPGQLVELLHHYPGEPEPGFNGFSWDAYQTIRDGNHVFSDLIVGTMNFFTVRGDKLQPQTVFGGGVGGNFFQALGVRAAAGRLIGPEDVHMGYHAPVAVVSWSFWKSRFDLGPDGNGGAAAAPCVREFSRAALGPRSIAPARNGGACLPRSASGSLAAPNAHRIAVAVAGRMRRRHLRGLLRSSRADPGFRIRQVHHRGAGAF